MRNIYYSLPLPPSLICHDRKVEEKLLCKMNWEHVKGKRK